MLARLIKEKKIVKIVKKYMEEIEIVLLYIKKNSNNK